MPRWKRAFRCGEAPYVHLHLFRWGALPFTLSIALDAFGDLFTIFPVVLAADPLAGTDSLMTLESNRAIQHSYYPIGETEVGRIS